MNTDIIKIPSYSGFPLILQKSKLLNKTLNRKSHFSFYARIKDYLKYLVVRHLSMCSNKLFYFRLTNPDINISYLYWHIVQDFQNGVVHRLGGNDYIGLYQLSRHIIYVRTTPHLLISLGQFVKKERLANLSIGGYPRNFGQVTLLNTCYLGELR